MRNKRKRFDECEDIKEELSEIRKQMSQMMSMLTNLSLSQQEFNNKMNNDVSDIKEQMANIKTNIQNLTIEQNTIKSDILNIKSNNNITNKNVEALQSEACEQHRTRNGEEGERIEDGVQMHGEYQHVPGSGAPVRRTGAGNILDGRPLGATEPELCGYLFAVAREKESHNIEYLQNSSLVNNIKPGMVKKVNESKMAFKCMENINAFLEAARQLGLPAQETF
ncbi:unnamed protein product [Parnassius apollo]|uniref:(apollo) hypothetical protein n=1 Tax=Parnassius apollo TaxID=110799 RepID=A0A8S3WI02_PARAO|nr:unnamed protein product [Parnassius apollo]